MQINSLYLEQFRNYTKQEITFDPVCNVIYGDNAQGKTNLLEAIVYLSSLRSPRTRLEKEMIHFGESHCVLEGTVFAQERDRVLKAELTLGQRKKVWVNGVPIKKSGELSGLCNTVYFCPEDLNLVRSSAAERRHFMDVSLCQLRPKYDEALSVYKRLYEQKTRCLRDSEEKPDLLNVLPDYNLQMTKVGAILIHYRAQYCKKLAEYAAQIHKECSGEQEQLSLIYETVSNIEDPFAPLETLQKQLMERQEQLYSAEIASRMCLCGPHKDDFSLSINGKAAKSFASQGQVRTIALSLKLADREIHKNVYGEYPLLLLDDVLSELDKNRQEFVLNRIRGGQVFITCCEDDRLQSMLKGKVFHIQQGQVV